MIHDEQREKDVQSLADAVLYISTDFWDNPNGGYESTCPFCGVTEIRGGGGGIQAYMRELDHKPDCAYLIAKDLSTNL